MKSILALVDFSDVTPAVLKASGDLARATGLKLHLLHAVQTVNYVAVTEVGPIMSRDVVAEALRAAHDNLQSIEGQMRAGGLDVASVLADGSAVDKAIDLAVRLEAAYIVLGSHGHGALYHLLLGNVATGVIRKSPCPVVVVPCRPA